jgi:hypothetical protein
MSRMNAGAVGPAAARVPIAAWFGWGLATSAALSAWSLLRGWTPGGEPICLLRRFAHVDCPTCGMSRALGLLARGEWQASLSTHPWALAIVLQLIAGWVLWSLAIAAKSRGERRRWTSVAEWTERRVPMILAANALTLIAIWVVRLAMGTLPN